MVSVAKSDLVIYRRFLPVLRPYRARLLLAVVASTTGPLLAAARIWLLKVLIDTVVRDHRLSLLPVVAAAFIGIAGVRGGLSACEVAMSGRVGTGVVRDLRVRLYAHLHGLSLRYFHKQRLGDLLTRLSGDIAAIEDLLVSGVTAIVSYCAMIALFVTLLIYLDPGLLLVAAGVLPVLVVTTVIEARLGRRAQRDIRECTSDLTCTAEEGLSAIALVKSFARGCYEVARFTVAADRSAAARLRAVGIRTLFPPLSEFVGAVGTAIVVWVGARQVADGHLSLGALVVFISYLASLYVPIQGLSRLASTVQRALVGAERVIEVLDAPAEHSERADAQALPAVRGRVEFSHVTFGYTADRPVLHDVSFAIAPGEMLALIGASGAGKTTAVSLLLDYYDVDSGTIRIDGHPLHRYDPESVRLQVAAVLQEPMLFDSTVRENIRYGRLDATDEDIRAAARVAEADEFIGQLPDGYDTVTGPRGSRLSGGQRQRLAIARALLKTAPVLVLDEGTSALDPPTEARLLPALRAACPDRAILLVAHRYSTVRHADRIVVLDRGRITEQGTPAALASTDGHYRAFLRSQHTTAT